MREFIVGVIHTALNHYRVTAESWDEAKEKAKIAFAESAPEVSLGNEYDEIDRVFIEEG